MANRPAISRAAAPEGLSLKDCPSNSNSAEDGRKKVMLPAGFELNFVRDLWKSGEDDGFCDVHVVENLGDPRRIGNALGLRR